MVLAGSGCGHDGDLIWTSTAATAEAIELFQTKQTRINAISGVCAGPTAKLTGDPHVTPFGGAKYDCHGHGEFVIAMANEEDPLSIHGRFVRVRDTPKPTITKAVAFKVVADVPIIQATLPGSKIGGKCPFTFTFGKDETPIDDIFAFVEENFNGAVTVFEEDKNYVFTYPEAEARISITAGGIGARCVVNSNVCLTPENHGGAANIFGLLGSPDEDPDNDWKGRNGTIYEYPAICSIEDPTNVEKKQCKSAMKSEGHEYCMEEWCVGHADNSLWSNETHAEYNECLNRDADDFFDDDSVDPEIQEACEDVEEPEDCEVDCGLVVDEGGNLTECVLDIINATLPVMPPTNATNVTMNTDTATIAPTIMPDVPSDDEKGSSESSGSLGDPHCKFLSSSEWFLFVSEGNGYV